MNDKQQTANLFIELEQGQLTWKPKTVIFEGKEYLAPLNILPIFAYKTLVEFFNERKNTYQTEP